jgi:hypothetical protein
VVEHRIGQILNIHGDAVAEHQHQHDAAERGEGQADRVALEFQGFPLREAEQPPQAESAPGGGNGFCRGDGQGRWNGCRCWRPRRFLHRL